MNFLAFFGDCFTAYEVCVCLPPNLNIAGSVNLKHIINTCDMWIWHFFISLHSFSSSISPPLILSPHRARPFFVLFALSSIIASWSHSATSKHRRWNVINVVCVNVLVLKMWQHYPVSSFYCAFSQNHRVFNIFFLLLDKATNRTKQRLTRKNIAAYE